jgi:hypothetical protein
MPSVTGSPGASSTTAVLAVVTIWQLFADGTFPRPIGAGLAVVFILAAVANVLYSTAYVIDLFVQLSAFQSGWRRRRWLLLLAGTLLGGVLAYFVAQGMFGSE